MDNKEKYLNDVPTYWELPFRLKKKLVKEFIIYVINQIRFRHWVMFFSFWALAFQTDKLLDSYLIYDTVVKVEIKKPYTISMPGVTICTDEWHMVARKKLIARYPQILDEIREKNLTEEEDIIVVLRKWKEIAYANTTVDQWFSLMADPDMVLTCKMIMKPTWHKQRKLDMPDCYNMSKVLYNLPHGSGICWIFFSQVNPRDYRTKDWVDKNDWYQIDVELGILASFYIHFDAFTNNEFVYDPWPDTVDEEDRQPELAAIINYPKAVYPIISLDRATLKRGTNYEITFSQTNARMLNAPYHTDCRDYEVQGYWKQYKSNYHCIDGCLQKYMRKCGCIYEKSRGDRITQWPAEGSWASNLRFCEDMPYQDHYNDSDTCRSADAFLMKYSDSECQLRKKCKNHCFEEYYRYEVKQMFWDDEIDGKGMPENEDDEYFFARGDPEYVKAKTGQNWSTMRIKRKDIADVTYEHTAEMIFVEFVCYFGGLLGLWLGVSILDCYHQSLIWYAEAPGEYRKWLEKQQYSSNVDSIRVERNGRISVINDIYEQNNQRKTSIINRMPAVDNYNTQYSTNFGTQFE